MNRSNIVVTSRGIGIGSAYIPPPPVQSNDADLIQSVMLRDRDRWDTFEGVLEAIDAAVKPVFFTVIVVAVVFGVVRAFGS